MPSSMVLLVLTPGEQQLPSRHLELILTCKVSLQLGLNQDRVEAAAQVGVEAVQATPVITVQGVQEMRIGKTL